MHPALIGGMQRITTCVAMVSLLVACGGGEIGGQGAYQADGGPSWDPADGASFAGDDAGPAPDTGPAAWKGNGAETCGDGQDNDGDGKVDENCTCKANSAATQGCYTGDPKTRRVGQCVDGKQACITSGEFATWGQCTGVVLPQKEICWDGKDNDCNGKVDDAPYCVCQVGQTKACYSGPPATKGVGRCKAGTQKCNAAGNAWLKACVGQILPGKEVCNNNIDDDCDGQIDEGCFSPIKPVTCNTTTLKHVVGGKDCGPNRAVYMIDDGSGPNMVCCQLPATDILTGLTTVRSGQCASDEVIVGATGTGTFKCQGINTKRYYLGTAGKPCYFGSGFSGGQGVSKCAGHPHSFSILQQNLFGSDGCSGYPYGSLFVRQTGKKCKDMLARRLYFTGKVLKDVANAPVKMF